MSSLETVSLNENSASDRSMEIAAECDEEKNAEPLPYRREGPYEGDDERLRSTY